MTSYVKSEYQSKELNSNMVKQDKMISLKEKWHRTLGHVNFNYLDTLCKNELLEGLPKNLEPDYMKCEVCIESKMHNLKFENNRKHATEILELIHTDLNGPHPIEGYRKERYFLTFIDDFSKLAKVYTIKHKSDVFNCFVEYVNHVENLTNKKIKEMICDNGLEYMNNDIYTFVRERGIHMRPCPPYVHELNGVAERYNRSVMDMSRCLMKEARVNKMYWPEIVQSAAFLKNRTLANTVEQKTPYEIFFGIRPSAKYLKLYGSRVYVRMPEQLRKTKWDNKSNLGVLLGYTEVGYRVLVNNRVITARHVDVVEEDTILIGLENDDSNDLNDKVDAQSDISNQCNKNQFKQEMSTQKIDQANENVDGLRRSNRERLPNKKYVNNDYVTQYVYVNFCNATVPNTFEEAITCNESKNWKKAMDKEFESLTLNNTWELVDKPKNKELIDVKWLFKKKNDDIFKARLVARGFQQEEYLENIYSPVVKMETLKILLAYCCQNGLIVEQGDFDTAYLNSELMSIIYTNQAKGYEDGSNKVYKLLKALYGLRESPRMWYECFSKFMEELNFKRSDYDNCLFTKTENDVTTIVLLFVDDFLVCSKSQKAICEYKTKVKERFKIKDLGKVSHYIGIDIDYDLENNVMALSQTKYIESLAIKYNLQNAKLYSTPMEPNLKLEPAVIQKKRNPI